MRASVRSTALALSAMVAVVAFPAAATDPGSEARLGLTDDRAELGEQPITVTGTIATSIDVEGQPIYTLQGGSQAYILEAGPSWYWGDDHPLGAYVGVDVTITGARPDGSTDIDVLSIDGTALRERGKPPWAGGWKRVGELHPGWKQAQVDRSDAKLGDCFPPGHCKDRPGKFKASKVQDHHSGHEPGILGRLLLLLRGDRDPD